MHNRKEDIIQRGDKEKGRLGGGGGGKSEKRENDSLIE